MGYMKLYEETNKKSFSGIQHDIKEKEAYTRNH